MMVETSTTKSRKRSERLLELLDCYPEIVVITHDNPDPDAIASSWVIHSLVKNLLKKKVCMLAGGAILRAENLHMMRLLKPPLQLTDSAEINPEAGIVLVDCGFGAGNHLLAKNKMRPVAVIDHHPPQERPGNIPFEDIRPHVSACASMVSTYMQELRRTPSERLATGLLYAIRTDVSGSETSYARLDRTIFAWLHEHANPSLLAEIENAPLPSHYYGDLTLALQNSFIYDRAVVCMLPRAGSREIVAEVSDLLIRCSGVRYALCAAVIDGDIMISIRASTGGRPAGVLAQGVLKDIGRGGGHQSRAGGKVTCGGSEEEINKLKQTLFIRWLDVLDIPTDVTGQRLVAMQDTPG